ncbi:MAG: dockerin type I domain-containing protein [Tepidisphaerales bacterium]
MRNFTASPGLTFLQPGTSMTLNSGSNGAAVTYSALGGSNTTSVQLAASSALAGVDPNPTNSNPVGSANYLGIQVEWHEQGATEGILELISDQIAPVTTVTLVNRNPSTGNPTWVNGNVGSSNLNRFTAVASTNLPETHSGFTLEPSTFNTYTNYAPDGTNLQGGQNRVQMSISDMNSVQAFSKAGTPSPFAAPGTPGYGLGNPALSIASTGIQGLGIGGVRHQLNPETIANMPTNQLNPSTIDPAHGVAGTNYPAGPWNTAGNGNLTNTPVAVAATLFVANPGTGLEHLNRSDAQWLQATGRLANGALFEVTTRDAYSGTLNVASNNVGLDPSYCVGVNDNGNGNDPATGGTSQVRIGPDLRFSNKTSGGSGVRPTVQNARMAVGHLVLSDAIGSTKNGVARPLRALDYRDDANDVNDNSNGSSFKNFTTYTNPTDPVTYTTGDLPTGVFIHPSFASIVSGAYPLYQNETYVTVKVPDPTLYTQNVIKGDDSGNSVLQLRNNAVQSAAQFPADSSFGNPANSMLATSYLPLQMVRVTKVTDGLNMSTANTNYNGTLVASALSNIPTLAGNFTPDAASSVTTGTGSFYGNSETGAAATPVAPAGGAIPINSKNWLFGNFDQRPTAPGISGKGYRDYSDLLVAQRAQAALYDSGLGVDWNQNAGSNSTIVTGSVANPIPAELTSAAQGGPQTVTKGDLIVLGDYNGDGKFDGKDLYLMATGSALADNTSSNVLTGPFADAVRNGVLRKNAALDLLNATATPQQKIDASANLTNDPTGANAFNKFDVNRDGKVNLQDAKVVDQFIGKNYANLTDQLAAVTTNSSGAIVPFNLINAKLIDGSTTITWDGTANSDFGLIKQQLGLIPGDLNFDGVVNIQDFAILSANFGTANNHWSAGDLNGDGVVNIQDFAILSANFGTGSLMGADVTPADWQALAAFGRSIGDNSVVPEPGSLTVMALGAIGLLIRRRRS